MLCSNKVKGNQLHGVEFFWEIDSHSASQELLW